MKIIGLSDGFGCAYHRISTPLELMGVDYIICSRLEEEYLEKGCDFLYFNRFPHLNTYSEIIDWRKKYGFRIVIDIDDTWNLGHSHVMKQRYDTYSIPQYIKRYLSICDAVSTTHERLAELIYPLNKNVWIIPNAIPEGYKQFKQERLRTDKIKVFWQGGIGHEKDLKILENPMKKVYSDFSLREKIFMVMCGYMVVCDLDKQIWDKCVKYFTNSMKLKGTVKGGQPVDSYYDFYKYADVSLIPLIKSEFNTYKSNLKILEAANMGIPCIVSKVDPYLGFDGLVRYVENQQDWYKHLKELSRNPEQLEIEGKMLKEYCDKNYNYEEINKERKKMFEDMFRADNGYCY